MLDRIDAGLGQASTRPRQHLPADYSLRLGLLVFTPREIEHSAPIRNDRPYANLIHAEFSRFVRLNSERQIHRASLSLGILGTGVGKSLHIAIQRRLDAELPRGYGRQISAAGEPTFRYARGFYRNLTHRRGHDLTLGFESAIDYSTDASIGLNLRAGRRESSWSTSLADFSDYAARAAPSVRFGSRSRDFYFVSGVGLRLQIYSAFLQGQVRRGPHARDLVWGSLSVMRAFG